MPTDFFEKVYELTRKIPYGKVTTYGAIAKQLGSAKSARMVGWALNKSSSQKEFVPAHRVVNRLGLLSGKAHFGNMNTMQELLENEGVEILNNQIINLEKYLWLPE